MKKVIWQTVTKKRIDFLINHLSEIGNIDLVIENDLEKYYIYTIKNN